MCDPLQNPFPELNTIKLCTIIHIHEQTRTPKVVQIGVMVVFGKVVKVEGL